MGHQSRRACCLFDNAMKNGTFRRVSDRRWIQRYRCKTCKKSVSKATFDPAYYQKKWHINYSVAMLRETINRLIRKSGCTTKKTPRLLDHLIIYTWVLNSTLTPQRI